MRQIDGTITFYTTLFGGNWSMITRGATFLIIFPLKRGSLTFIVRAILPDILRCEKFPPDGKIIGYYVRGDKTDSNLCAEIVHTYEYRMEHSALSFCPGRQRGNRHFRVTPLAIKTIVIR